MPKAWSQDEKDLVKKSLMAQGRRLFEKFGLRKTSVDEIVKAVGISKGAFYHFYESKEELYFEILGVVEREFKDRVYETASRPGCTPRENFRKFLRTMLDAMTTTPLFRQINSADLQYLMRKVPSDALEKHFEHDQEYFERYFDAWIRKGWMRNVSMKALNGLLLSLIYFAVQRDELAGMDFKASKDLFIDMLAEYLIP